MEAPGATAGSQTPTARLAGCGHPFNAVRSLGINGVLRPQPRQTGNPPSSTESEGKWQLSAGSRQFFRAADRECRLDEAPGDATGRCSTPTPTSTPFGSRRIGCMVVQAITAGQAVSALCCVAPETNGGSTVVSRTGPYFPRAFARPRATRSTRTASARLTPMPGHSVSSFFAKRSTSAMRASGSLKA